VSKLPQLVLETKNDLADAGIKSTIVGHVGDGERHELMHLLTNNMSFLCPLCTGNFHALLLFKDDDGHAQVTEAARRLARRAIALDGTCKYLDSQQSPSQIPPKYSRINKPLRGI
jgi:D-lactate dehydrogenase (cytochrome)